MKLAELISDFLTHTWFKSRHNVTVLVSLSLPNRVLDPQFSLLRACFPVVVVMWIINLILTLVAWFASIRNRWESKKILKYLDKSF